MVLSSENLLPSDFVSGAKLYERYYSGYEASACIVLTIEVEKEPTPVQAIVDTGAQWTIFDPILINGTILDGLSDQWSEETSIMIRGTLYEGRLVRTDVTLRADYGEDLTIDATVFVPFLDPDDDWPWPNFLGMDGFLDRMHSAIDPTEGVFYFGPV